MGTAVLLLLGAAIAAVAMLAVLLARTRRRARLFASADERRLTQIGDLERETREARDQADRARLELDEQRSANRTLVHDRNTTKAWNRQLRKQLAEAQASAGTIGDPGDTRQLVLRTAVGLLGASKGLLLTHEDVDADGDLDLVCAIGFDASPEHSSVVQHLAQRTLSEEETLRIDHPEDFEGDGRTEADAEIDNLVAIPVYIQDRFHGVVVAANKDGGFHEYDDEVLLALGDHAGIALDNARLHGRLRNAYVATVRVLAEAIEAKDPFLRGHSDEVSELVAGVARRLELGAKEREELVFGSLLHDIGKIGISERILTKPGPLSIEERAVVQLHPRIGYRLVEQVPELRPIALAILHHHERWDGDGYPSGLKGEEIPLPARVVAIADAFSAMISERPYGVRLAPRDACEELKRCAGEQFDPELVQSFCEEVARRGDRLTEPGALDRALADPELQHRRDGDSPVLGTAAAAATDSATLLYSHRYLHEEARTHAQSAALHDRPFGVLVCELTELERMNRDEGFAAGDAALYALARELERVAVRAGGIAARLSGRRLAVLVPGADEEEIRGIAEDIRPDVAVRVGCAVWTPGDAGDEVVARARRDFAATAAT